MIGDALIDVLVVATEDGELVTCGESLGVGMGKYFSARREQNDRRLRAQRFDGLEEGAGLHHHPRTAAVGIVVDGAMLVVGELTQIDDVVRHAASGDRSRWNA